MTGQLRDYPLPRPRLGTLRRRRTAPVLLIRAGDSRRFSGSQIRVGSISEQGAPDERPESVFFERLLPPQHVVVVLGEAVGLIADGLAEAKAGMLT